MASLLVIGDHSEVSGVESVTENLMSTHNISLLFGPYGSTLTQAAAAVANLSGAAMVAPAGSDSAIFESFSNVFGILPPASSYFEPAVKHMANHSSTIAFVQEDAQFTRTACQMVEHLAATHGMEFLGGYTLPSAPNTSTVGQVVEQLQALGPDLVIGCVYTDACSEVLRLSKNAQFLPQAFIFTTCVTSPGFIDDIGSDGYFAMGVAPWLDSTNLNSNNFDAQIQGSDSSEPGVDIMSLNSWNTSKFTKTYLDEYGREPPYQAASTWAACVTMVAAIEKANSTVPADVVSALSGIYVTTLFGDVSFNENGQNTYPTKVVQVRPHVSVPVIVAPAGDAIAPMIYPMPKYEDHLCFQTDPDDFAYGFNASGICALCGDHEDATFSVASLMRTCEPCIGGQEAIRVSLEPERRRCPDCLPGYVLSATGECAPCPAGLLKLYICCTLVLVGFRSDRCQAIQQTIRDV